MQAMGHGPALHFAGRQEYLADLQAMRDGIHPLKKELAFDMKANQQEGRLADLEEREDAVRNGHGPLKGIRLRALRAREMGSTIGILLRALVTFGPGELDGKEQIRQEAKGPEAAAAYREKMHARAQQRDTLQATVTRLREESDPAQAKWLREFEAQSKPLSQVERFVLKTWNA